MHCHNAADYAHNRVYARHTHTHTFRNLKFFWPLYADFLEVNFEYKDIFSSAFVQMVLNGVVLFIILKPVY